MHTNRIQISLWILLGLFVLAASFAVLLYLFLPETPASRGPLLLASFVVILIGSLLCILFLLRWLLRPYRQLLGEAERASVEAHTHKSKDEAGFVLETFQSVVAQLQTQRKELETLSAQASERADSAERFSERIVASVPSGLIAFDVSGRSMVINEPGRALLEVDGKALGQPAALLLKNAPKLAEMVQQCLETGRLYRREAIDSTTRDGWSRRLGATVAPIDLSPDRARGALCLLTDITEVTQLREAVVLKRNLESLGEMSAGLAHEFKNVIATLHGYVQLLQSLELNETGRTATSSLLKEVRNLSELVTSFLNFARPQPLELESISPASLIGDCATELATLLSERRVQLNISTGNDSLETRADERLLRQALLNLLRNGVEAIGEEQSERWVEVSSYLERDKMGKQWVLVEIADSGPGIPLADLQRIFIPFFTTKATGHGVGLALAHRVIAEHGGSITAANRKGSGAVFTIRLPM
jgi:nitrogen fixation/metabolism regulation signal transduction histidine kinase